VRLAGCCWRCLSWLGSELCCLAAPLAMAGTRLLGPKQLPRRALGSAAHSERPRLRAAGHTAVNTCPSASQELCEVSAAPRVAQREQCGCLVPSQLQGRPLLPHPARMTHEAPTAAAAGSHTLRLLLVVPVVTVLWPLCAGDAAAEAGAAASAAAILATSARFCSLIGIWKYRQLQNSAWFEAVVALRPRISLSCHCCWVTQSN